MEVASRADAPAERETLRGRFSRRVVDTWSWEAPLSEELVAFDQRFLVP